jgi:type I restriction enzyme M protein
VFEQTFKNIDDILHKDAGCGSELDYVEQTSWVLFLKYLDDLEKDRATAAELTGKTYTPIIDREYQWTTWAAPKLDNGKIDHNALTGDDLTEFVNIKLFPYLKRFKTSADSANTIEYKIGEIFSEL